MAETPQWRQAYDAVDRQIAPRLEELVRSEQFAVLVGIASRMQSSVERQATQTSRRLLHRFNLPAGSDVTRILNELGQLRREIHELRHDLTLVRAAVAAARDDSATVASIAAAPAGRSRTSTDATKRAAARRRQGGNRGTRGNRDAGS